MKKRSAVLLAIVAIVALTVPGAAIAQDTENNTADVYVIHGIPGEDLGLDPALPVDVLVDDALCLLEGFEFGDQAGPVALDEGTYNIKIGLADETNPCDGAANSPVIEADVPFVAGESATVIAHLTEDIAPTASKFTLDVSRVGVWVSRIGVYHTAAAPAVDVKGYRDRSPGRTINLLNVSNGEGGAVKQVWGDWTFAIYPAGEPDPVFGPFPFFLEPFYARFVYAVGSLENGTFQLLVQEIFCRFNPR
jgi:hypothetical protein